MRSIVVLALILAIARTAHAADPVIGLLTLPEVFGAGPCDRFTPREVALYAEPDSAAIVGSIRVDRNWTFAPHGGCEGLAVGVHLLGTGDVSALPAMEYEYEAPAAIVLRQQGRWFEVRLSEGTGWVRASERDQYLSLQQLLADGLTHLTESWDRMLAPEPGGVARVPLPPDPRRVVVGYLEGEVRRVRVVLEPGQSLDSVRAHYRASAVGTRAGPNGTKILSIETGTVHPLFTAPDRDTRPVGDVESNRCGYVLQTAGENRVLVFQHRPGWYEVARAGPDWRGAERLWLEEATAWRFHPVDDETERERLARQSFGPEHLSTRVTGFREIDGRLWVQVEVSSHSPCQSMEEPSVRGRGWIPAHAPSGELNIWFSSRGC